MIKLIGTSHVSPESIKTVRKEVDEDVDCVAVELDTSRYHSMRSGKRSKPGTLFGKILSWIQIRIGKKTGIMPGEEMLKAVQIAQEREKDAFLIDQPINKTMVGINSIGVLEKIKLLFSSIFFFKPVSFDFNEVPPTELVEEVLEHLEKHSPKLYRILVKERDKYMAREIQELNSRYENLLVVVGIGHIPGIKGILDSWGLEYRDKTF